mgnify:CR=1 FL=1
MGYECNNVVFSFKDAVSRLRRCNLYIFEETELDRVVCVCMPSEQDMALNISLHAPVIATAFLSTYKLQPQNLVWIEHHPRNPTQYGIVSFKWDGKQFVSAKQRPLTLIEASELNITPFIADRQKIEGFAKPPEKKEEDE